MARQRNQDPSLYLPHHRAVEAELSGQTQRSTRKMSFNRGRCAFIDKVQSLLEELHSAMEEAASNHRTDRTLRLIRPVTFGHHCLLPLLSEFRSQYPKIN